MLRIKTTPILLSLIASALFTSPIQAQIDFSQIQIQTQAIRGGAYLLSNAGGNILAFYGEDGVFLVDAGMEGMAQKVLAAVEEAAETEGASASIRYLVNTHWHYDHTGGNASVYQSGAAIIGHEHQRRLMSEDRVLAALEQDVPASPADALPVLTFNDRVNLEWNGTLIHMVHQPLAHSDGDLIVHIGLPANIVHMGDLFFNGMYPYIDVDYGGNAAGMISAIEDVLAHTNENIIFVPGHGPLADRADLAAYLEMLQTTLDNIQPMVDRGMTREEVIAAKPTASIDSDWVRQEGSEEADFFVGLVYDGIVRAEGGG